jgi:hypothetical protein
MDEARPCKLITEILPPPVHIQEILDKYQFANLHINEYNPNFRVREFQLIDADFLVIKLMSL